MFGNGIWWGEIGNKRSKKLLFYLKRVKCGWWESKRDEIGSLKS